MHSLNVYWPCCFLNGPLREVHIYVGSHVCKTATLKRSAVMGFPLLPLPWFMDALWIIHDGVALPSQLKTDGKSNFLVTQTQQLTISKCWVWTGCGWSRSASFKSGPRVTAGAVIVSQAHWQRLRYSTAGGWRRERSTAAGLMKCFCSNLSRLKLKIKEWSLHSCRREKQVLTLTLW